MCDNPMLRLVYSSTGGDIIYIYKIVNKVNGKIYVGQTTETLKQRFSRHMGYQKDSSDTKFYRAVRKYGVNNFYIELLEEVQTQEDLNAREEYWIRLLNTVEDGYNSYYGGFSSGGDTLSNHPRLEEIKISLSNIRRGGNNPHASKIVCENLSSGEIKIYMSIKECQIDLDIPRHDIVSRRCSGKIKAPYKNTYNFYYYEDYNKQSSETIESVGSEKDTTE